MFCPHCGNQINDNAFVCVHCGVRVDEPTLQTDEKRFCSHCGNQIAYNAYICVHCGSKTEYAGKVDFAKQRKNHTPLILAILSVVMSVLATGLIGAVLAIIGMVTAIKSEDKVYTHVNLAVIILVALICILRIVVFFLK